MSRPRGGETTGKNDKEKIHDNNNNNNNNDNDKRHSKIIIMVVAVLQPQLSYGPHSSSSRDYGDRTGTGTDGGGGASRYITTPR